MDGIACLEMHLEAEIERDWRCTWRPRSSERRDALGGRDRASLEMQLETVIERDWTSTWGRSMDGAACLEMHLEAVIEQDWMSTWRRSMDGAPGLNSSVSLLATVGM